MKNGIRPGGIDVQMNDQNQEMKLSQQVQGSGSDTRFNYQPEPL